MAEKDHSENAPVRLLLVDDEQGFVNVLSKRIAKRNIQVRKAFSGFEAIQILREEKFDVAVLDLKMEDMDGIEVLKIFKKMAPNLQVIMLTGHGSEIAAREGMEYGAMDYLIKPCDFDVLIEKIQQAVSLRR
jgi:DNA-binding NtrC family response regulator